MELACFAYAFYVVLCLSGVAGHSLSMRALVHNGFPAAVFSGCFLMTSAVGLCICVLEVVAATVHTVASLHWLETTALKDVYVILGWFLTAALFLCCVILATDRLLILRRRAHSPTWESRRSKITLSAMVLLVSGCASVTPVLLGQWPDCADLQLVCQDEVGAWTASRVAPLCLQAVLALTSLTLIQVALRGNALSRFNATVLQLPNNELRSAQAIRWFILELSLGRLVLVTATVVLRLVVRDNSAAPEAAVESKDDVTSDGSDVTWWVEVLGPLRYCLNLLSLTPVALAPFLLMGISRRYRRLALSGTPEKTSEVEDQPPFFISSSLSTRGTSVHPSTSLARSPVSVSCVINMEAAPLQEGPKSNRSFSPSDTSGAADNAHSGSSSAPQVFRFSLCEVQNYSLEETRSRDDESEEFENLAEVNVDCPSTRSSKASNDVSISTVVTSAKVGKHRFVRVSSSASFRLDPCGSEEKEEEKKEEEEEEEEKEEEEEEEQEQEEEKEEEEEEERAGGEEKKETGGDRDGHLQETPVVMATQTKEAEKESPPSPRTERKLTNPSKGVGVSRATSVPGMTERKEKRISLTVPSFHQPHHHQAQAASRLRRTTVHNGSSQVSTQDLSPLQADPAEEGPLVPKRAFQADSLASSPAIRDSPSMYSEMVFSYGGASIEDLPASPELPGYIRSPTSLRRALHVRELEVAKQSPMSSPVLRSRSASALYDPVSLVYLGMATHAANRAYTPAMGPSIF